MEVKLTQLRTLFDENSESFLAGTINNPASHGVDGAPAHYNKFLSITNENKAKHLHG